MRPTARARGAGVLACGLLLPTTTTALSPFAVPPSTAGFVPVLRDGSTLWLYLSALRDTAFPMIAQNQPARTLLIDAAADPPRCGLAPLLKGLGEPAGSCWPGALPWLWSVYEPFRRNEFVMRLHSAAAPLSTAGVFGAPGHAQFAGSAAPWEVLAARAEAGLRWAPAGQALALGPDLWVDTTPNWNKATSPAVRRVGTLPLRRRRRQRRRRQLGAAAEGGGARALHDGWDAAAPTPLFEDHHAEFSLFGARFELTDGMVRPSAEGRAAYPTLTALQHVFASPLHTRLARLVNASCWCPDPALAACPLSYLCLVLDRSVFTLFAPVDAAFDALTCDAEEFLLGHPDAAAAVVEYAMLGQPTFACPLEGPLRCSGPAVARRLDEQQQPAADHSADARALSARVNARLASLWASSAPQPPSSPPDDEDDAPTPTDAERVEALRAGEEAARRLGSFGASAGDLPDLPRHADDFLLWTTTPLLAPWPSWMHHEQLGDIVRNTQVFTAQTFHALLLLNASGGPPPPAPAWALLNGTNASRPFPGPVLSSLVPFAPAELLLSYGPPYPCRAPCAGCQRCRDECDACREDAGLPPVAWRRLAGFNAFAAPAGSGGAAAGDAARGPAVTAAGAGACADACSPCGGACYDCDCCRTANAGVFPAPLRRRQRRRMAAAGAPVGAEGAGGDAEETAAGAAEAAAPHPSPLPPPPPPPRALCDGCSDAGSSYGSPLTLTCVDSLCSVADWACTATTAPPYVGIETLNAVVHYTTGAVLLPPDVLVALRRAGIRAYEDSPPLHKTCGGGGRPCAGGGVPAPGDCPYVASGGGEELLGLGLGGVFAAAANLTQRRWGGSGGEGGKWGGWW